MGEITVASLLADLASIATAIMSQIATIASTITSTPILLLTVGFLFIGKICTTADVKLGKNGKSLLLDNTVVNYCIS